jgi:hypothetical protein
MPELLQRPRTGFSTPVKKWIVEAGLTKNDKNSMSSWAKIVLEKNAPKHINSIR